MPKVSIVIPTLNEERHLPKLLQSVKSQTFQDFEIIVADAHSKDKTRVLAEAAGARVVDGGMPGVGRNAGARAAQGTILLFLDADVVLPDSEFLGRVVQEFDDRGLDIATAMLEPLTERFADKAFFFLYNWYTVSLKRWVQHAPGFFMVVRRSLHEQIGGFDESLDFAEDHEYTLRAAREGRFGFLRSGRILVSVRRLRSDGWLRLAGQYIVGEWFILTKGKVPPGKMDYRFGHHDEAKSKKRIFKK